MIYTEGFSAIDKYAKSVTNKKTPDEKTIKKEMEKPQNDRDILINECDMLASRTFLTYVIPDDLIKRFEKNIKIK